MSGSTAWLVSPRFDLGVFLAPAVAALALAAFAPVLAPNGEVALPWWLITVLLIDVAHVWSTLYRTYLDGAELRRRPALYFALPLAAYAGGVMLYTHSPASFWTALAYLAVWHFVRQQYGWVALYNRRAGEGPLDRKIDAAAIYGATLFPILWWHAHLPRAFDWFVPGDFVASLVPASLVAALWPIYAGVLAAFVVRQVLRYFREGVVRSGKIIVVASTALCWGVGIVATNTDFAFTVTNVIIHGVPYLAVVWIYGRRATHAEGTILAWIFGGGRWLTFLALVVVLAYLEELGWDRLLWHDHPLLFPGPELSLGRALEALVVPLLALPQATHYLLDAWIWRIRENPSLAAVIERG